MVRSQLPAQVFKAFNRTVLKNWDSERFLNITIRIKVKYIPSTEKIISIY